jgi:hypothetical protein
MDRYLKITSLVLVVLLLGSTIVLGGNKDRIGTAAAPELLIPVGARGVAMGASMISNISGIDAIYYNPAGLVRGSSNIEIMFSNMTYFADMNVIYLAASAKAGSLGTFALSLKSLSIGNINQTTVDFPDGTGLVYSPSYVNLGFTYSTQLIDRVSVGATATWISHTIMSTTESGFGLNFGIQYVGLGLPGLSLGVAIKNIGSSMSFAGSDLYQQVIYTANTSRPTEFLSIKTAPADLPAMLELGVGYVYKIDEQTNFDITGNYMNAGLGEDEYRLGGEFAYDNMLFVRAGYNFVPDAAKDVVGNSSYMFNWAAGAGYKTDLGGLSVGLDYTYQNMKIFNGNHVITLTMGF